MSKTTMSTLDNFLNRPSEWLKASGPDSDVVISSRVRLARNLKGFSFGDQLDESAQHQIVENVQAAVGTSRWMKKTLFLLSQHLSEVDKQFLLERHLISREHATEKGEKAIAVTEDEIVSLMVLEEDHLRLQVFQSGFNLMESWRIVDELDDELEKYLDYSFGPSLGYLTACPTNVGTGLRASCMLHLPGLVLTKQVQKVLKALSKLNLAVRGLYGEGTQATGNLFQFSNQITLGQQETEIVDSLECVIRQVIGHEREARDYLKAKKKEKYEDQVFRALGALKTARIVTSQEATQLLSLVQLGFHQGLIETDLTIQEINALFLLIQPAHLQKLAKKELTADERDLRRAALIREKLSKISL